MNHDAAGEAARERPAGPGATDQVAEDLPLPGVVHLRCDNPGPMTLSGTNTYVIPPTGVHADAGVVVIDPGPDDARHRQAIVDAVTRQKHSEAAQASSERRRVTIVLTHHHDDHEGGARAVVSALESEGLDVEVVGGGLGRTITDGEVLAGLQLVAVPGHTADSLACLLERDRTRTLFSGDTVLGAGSSFVAHPDGDLTAYLASLDVLAALVGDGGAAEARGPHDAADSLEPGSPSGAPEAAAGAIVETLLAPGHGPVGGDAAAQIETYRTHRQQRLDEVRRALAVIDAERAPGEGDLSADALADAVVSIVYADIDASLRPAVDAIVRAQLAHLGRL